jgi:hypothetical protein
MIIAFEPWTVLQGREASLQPELITQSATDQLTYAGISPTTISLYWTPSKDSTFSQYVIREADTNQSGFLEFETVASIYQPAMTSYYATGETPGATDWWQVYYYNQTGFAKSEVLKVTQPPVASLTYSVQGPSSILLSWNNTAQYGGLLAFYSYQIFQSTTTAGPFVSIATIGDPNIHSYPVDGLISGAEYSFYLNTTDQCVSCGNPSFSSYESGIVTVVFVGPLSASVAANRSLADVGQTVSFSCKANGGTPPYGYSWDFRDGTSGEGPGIDHAFDKAGTMYAICTVTDFLGISSESATSISVYPRPSLAALTAQPSSVNAGELVTITATVKGGSGQISYSWSNLPRGCDGGNRASMVCAPSSSGNYEITLVATDTTGENATGVVTLTVGPANVAPSPTLRVLAILVAAIGTAASITVTVAIVMLRHKPHRGFRQSMSVKSRRVK